MPKPISPEQYGEMRLAEATIYPEKETFSSPVFEKVKKNKQFPFKSLVPNVNVNQVRKEIRGTKISGLKPVDPMGLRQQRLTPAEMETLYRLRNQPQSFNPFEHRDPIEVYGDDGLTLFDSSKRSQGRTGSLFGI